MYPYGARQVGHETLAATIAAGGVVGAAFAGPLAAPAVELVSAALTGAVAAHALHASGEGDQLRRGVHRMTRDARAPLAAHALDLALRARRRDRRALRSAALIVGRVASAHARAVLAHVTLGWSDPLRAIGTAGSVARAALAGADLVHDLRRAAIARDPIAIEGVAMFEQPVNDAEEVAA
jgi:hypothetical protein